VVFVDQFVGSKPTNDQAIAKFGQSFRGALIWRSHPEYEEARKLYNAMIDKRPLLIARCADVADVIVAVNFGRENKLRHCHVWMSPADQGLFRRCAGRGCGHVFGLSRGELDPLALMLSADPLPRSRQRA
jgi:hypothetical protein